MKRKIVLHIGAHKTGSTALQAALQNHSNMLRDYDVATMPRSVAAEMFVHDLRPEARSIIMGTDASTLVITHEVMLGWPFGRIGALMPTHSYLYPQTKKRLEFLSRTLDNFDVEVIYYIRDQAAFLESFYVQSVQVGATFSFDDWISRVDLSQLSWCPIIDEIRAYFPVCVKRFETEFAHSQSMAFHNFLAVAAPSIPRQEIEKISFEKPANRSLNVTGLAMMMEINKIGLQPEHRNKMRHLLQQHLTNAVGDRPAFLSEPQRAALSAYTPENEALAQALDRKPQRSGQFAQTLAPRLLPTLPGQHRAIPQHEPQRRRVAAYSH
jgi:hypothetical protein